MKRIITYLFIALFSISFSINAFAKDALPETYTLTDQDYELVGNGKYDNFDVRSSGYESDPLVILRKLNQILDANFTYVESDVIKVTFAIYDGAQGTDEWDLYVEDLKFRTTEYVLVDEDPAYLDLGTSSTIDICTWNIEHYPKASRSEEKVMKIILDSKIDIFALQEISDDSGEFARLMQQLGDAYGSYIYNPIVDSDSKWDQNIAFVYKKDEITVVDAPHEISEFKGDTDAFPRIPIEVKFRHKSGVEFVVINIHLKCCDGSEDRRRDASEKMKTYIDENYKANNTAVVLLGDMNDRIDSGETDNVFTNFIDDVNYIFTDTRVSEESKDGSGWANIDHILINKPLFDANDKGASKLEKTDFEFDYDAFVSDHFPVWVNLNPELLSNDVNYIYKSKLNIYPNPNKDGALNIEMPEGTKSGELKIYDNAGKEVFSKNLNKESIDISQLSNGNYVVTFKGNNTMYTGKFVKK